MTSVYEESHRELVRRMITVHGANWNIPGTRRNKVSLYCCTKVVTEGVFLVMRDNLNSLLPITTAKLNELLLEN